MEVENRIIEGANFIKITNSTGLEVILSDFGAGIYSIKLNGAPMLTGLKNYKDWMNSNAYNGKTVGRIAGRLPSEGLHFQGKTYPISHNEGDHTLHGGVKGFSFSFFKMDVRQNDADIYVDFYLHSPEADQGFPGDVTLRVRYVLPEKENKLRIEYKVQADKDTPISLTNHSYFNLGASDDVLQDSLYVDSDEILTYDSKLIPQGYRKIPEFMDVSSPKLVKEMVRNEYLKQTNGLDTAFHKQDRNKNEAHIILENEYYKAIIKSSYDDVVVYSSNYPPFEQDLSNGKKSKLYGALAIEPQYEAFDFERMRVSPNKEQRNFIEYEFIEK